MALTEIEIGKTYKMRDGNVATVLGRIERIRDSPFLFYGNTESGSKETWTAAGRFLDGVRPHDFDLMSEETCPVTDPAAKPARKPHKHAELIKAWADGAEIEYKGKASSKWNSTGNAEPLWRDNFEYRVKPQPRPNAVTWHAVVKEEVCDGYASKEKLSKAYTGAHFHLRVEIDHNDRENLSLVSATLEKV